MKAPFRPLILAVIAVVAAFMVFAGIHQPQSALAQPANDDFASATVIGALPFSDPLSTAGATTEPDEPLPCGAKGST